MKKWEKYPKIERAYVKFEITDEELVKLSNSCFFKNPEYEEIKKTFKALAKM